MKCFLESGPSPTPKNAEGLPDLPPKIERGEGSAVSYQKDEEDRQEIGEMWKTFLRGCVSPPGKGGGGSNLL